MVRACHTPRQPLQNHPSGHRRGLATPRSAEEMLDGQHQRVDIPAHARTAHRGLLKRQDWKSIFAGSPLMNSRRPSLSRDWTELNWIDRVSGQLSTLKGLAFDRTIEGSARSCKPRLPQIQSHKLSICMTTVLGCYDWWSGRWFEVSSNECNLPHMIAGDSSRHQ